MNVGEHLVLSGKIGDYILGIHLPKLVHIVDLLPIVVTAIT